MEYNKIITISAFNRPDYLKQTLDSLNNCYGIENYSVRCFIDPSNQLDKILEVCGRYRKPWKLSVYINDKRLDCNTNIYKCLNWGFSQTDYLVHIEDDIVLSKDALLYFEYCGKKYEKDKEILTISAYNNGELVYKKTNNDEYNPSLNILHRQNNFAPWGWATWKDRWKELKENWQFGFDARYKDGKMILPSGCGWDVNVEQAILGNRKRICPQCPRCKNIGRLQGRHMSEAHFDEWQTWEKWSNDYKFDSNIKFTELYEHTVVSRF